MANSVVQQAQDRLRAYFIATTIQLIASAYPTTASIVREPTAFEKDRDRLLYLIAVDKPVGDLPERVARQGLEAIGRETCPYTGQHYFDCDD